MFLKGSRFPDEVLKGSRSPEVFDFRFSVDLFRIWPVLGILLGGKVNPFVEKSIVSGQKKR